MLLECEDRLRGAGADVPYLDIGILGRRRYHIRLFLIYNACDRCLVAREYVSLHIAQGPDVDGAALRAREQRLGLGVEANTTDI